MSIARKEIVGGLKELQSQENVRPDPRAFPSHLFGFSHPLKRRRLGIDEVASGNPAANPTGSRHSVSHDRNKPLQEKLPSQPADQAPPTGETNISNKFEFLIRAAKAQTGVLSESQKELVIANKRIADLTKQLDYAREECDSHYAKLNLTSKDYEKCRKKSLEDKLEWEAQEKDLKREKSELSSALEEAKDEIARSFMKGFHRAIEQVNILFPNTDLSVVDPLKIAVDGKIVAE
ncbi:uncharacterized protein LOC114196018 [Vigna unguiculata]|uniref:Uncharacterized protein n=1 Tax=Vigna unguiculata TaxID=3917 RepID=A0A4D6NVE2_VIGUN|nr:uncharacterized protein LOC114196018 [Vigna unguiculata]QCE15767.1 hypothetical protein DEO72_LG11g2779 [Vigna unguiculata]